LMGTGVGFLREAISAYDEQIDQIQHAFF
jgi:hypothetical protein